MKIETVRISRRFYCDNGVEESIDVEAKPVIGADLGKVASQLREALDQCGDSMTLETLEMLHQQTESARSELDAILRQIETAGKTLAEVKKTLTATGFDNEQIKRIMSGDIPGEILD